MTCLPARERAELLVSQGCQQANDRGSRGWIAGLLAALLALVIAPVASAASEASLVMPDLSSVSFLGLPGHQLLTIGIGVCILGLIFGTVIYFQLRGLPVHQSMKDVSELIYETCKTYMITQGKFLIILQLFIGAIMLYYFGWLAQTEDPVTGQLVNFPMQKVAVILGFSVLGILGSYSVAWFGIRVNTFANSRTAFAALGGKPYPCYAIPLKAGMSIGMVLISVELVIMLGIILFLPADYAGP